MAASHWGEIEETEGKESAAAVILTSIQGKFRNGFSNFDLPPLHQPSATHKGPKREIAKKSLPWLKMPVDSFGQNHLLHSIELQHYKKRMRNVFSIANSHQLDILKNGAAESTPLPSPPPLPKRFCSNDGHLKSSNPTSFLSNEFDASQGPVHQISEFKPTECPAELDPVSARQLLLKSVSAICAHTGFEFGSEVAINSLTDLLVDHINKLCKLFKMTVEHQPGGERNTDNVYVSLEHTFKEFGIDGILSLQGYWNKKIRQVAFKLEQESRDLLNEYNSQKDASNEKQKSVKEEII